MTLRALIARVSQQENLNFLLTNRIPRRLLTQFMGWFSKIERPLVRDASIGLWRLFSGLDLSEAKKTQFRSMHDCFIRELKDGARPVDAGPAVLISPCDAIVGASGSVTGTRLLQVKGFPYTLQDLLVDSELVDLYRDGRYVTLRLTSSMYHRFHAPHDCRVEQVTYISGDTWNVNPSRSSASRSSSARTSARSFERGWRRPDTRSRSCRFQPYWLQASGCTSSTSCSI